MKEFIEIQSSKSIVVTSGLQFQDATNPDAHVADRLKVAPLWPKLKIMIKAGKHTYPSFVKDWPTVKALEKDGIITVGAYVDNANEDVKEVKATLERQAKEVAKKETKVKDINLDDLSK